METSKVPVGGSTDFETLLKELNHRILGVRRDACEELGVRGDPRAAPHLLRMLQDGVGAVRFSAVEALGRLGDRAVVPALLKLLEDPHFGAYVPVIEALANLKAVEAVPCFIKLLRDSDPRVRSLAANALMVVTRQVISFKSKGSEPEREAAIQQWEAWWRKNSATFKPV